MPVYRVDAIKHVLKEDDIMYITEGFTYYLEDVFLSLMLWNSGFKCVALPIVAGEHYRMATIKKLRKTLNIFYYGTRNRMALLRMTNSKYRNVMVLKYLIEIAISRSNKDKRESFLKALVDGMKLGKELRKKYGVIDLYKAPLIKISFNKPLFRFLQRLAHVNQ